MTEEEIAAQLDAEADGLEASSDPVARAAARRLRLYAVSIRRLRGGTVSGTFDDDMLTSAQLTQYKSSAERKGWLHPLQAWLYSHNDSWAGPRTLEALAVSLKVTPEQVRSWCRKRASRRTPEDAAKRIERKWGFSATPDNYPNGIKSAKKQA